MNPTEKNSASSSPSDQFLSQVLSCVRFRYDHAVIRQELLDHIEDRKDNYMEEGVKDGEAEILAVSCMGDARELGEALNREHSPLLGWIWRISGWAASICVFLAVVLTILPLGHMMLSPFINSADNIPRDQIVYSQKMEERVQIDDRVIILRKVVFTQTDRNADTGTLHILWDNYEKRLHFSGWGFTLSDCRFTDQSGREYLFSGGYSSAGPLSRCSTELDGFPKGAETLYIDYDRYHRQFHIEIPLLPPGSGTGPISGTNLPGGDAS
ncbi:permease prefix domain 1-containing protein [Bacilliculturomica massiliensis]|uniref:permease prefix domain 1-containing protein n=1 Tax=Bacilliculturomica massiliensis TaxID=1917867 RepID=UPI00103162CC|nr:permease prefix domain 1-containing protein [Bacilliculturomica massiliensis]